MSKSYSPKFSFSLFVLFTISVATAFQPGLIAQESALSGSHQVQGGPSMEVIETVSLAVANPYANSSLPDAPDMARSASTTATSASPFAFSPTPVVAVPETKELGTPRFWDRENLILFAAVGGMAGADFYVTHANLASGGKELNPVTRVLSGSTPGLVANFALESGSVVAVSYLFHKTGHHRLERLTSVVNVASSAGAVSYGLTHR
jgi:hypothetical protein